MAFEIVDGMTGTKHISSDDLSALNIATIGKANCVLEYGDNFKLTMASANNATLGTGVGMVGGKRFWNQAATSLAVQSGTQGQKRNDLVVARYAKTSAGIESITPVVIKGTPSTGTAADPATTSNDLKLWRIPLNGISVGTPVALFDPVASLKSVGESVFQDTFYWLYSDKNYGEIVFYARGGIATLTVIDVNGMDPGTPWKIPNVIPYKFRPEFNFYGTLVHKQSNNIGQVWIPSKHADDEHMYIYAGVPTHSRTNSLNGSATWIYAEPTNREPNK
ncbi:MAG: hypothetical protein J7E10_13720 [Escherichia coli]|nr:hypothetical protein [Escherichia coli]